MADMTTVESLQTTQEAASSETTHADACYLALQARDARFDGRFFIGVTSTHIYCRPVCKVRVPKKQNCRFFDHAAQAEHAGFRPCLRCRPELAPLNTSGALNWSIQDASAMLAQQAARLLDEPDNLPPRAPTACGSLPPEGAAFLLGSGPSKKPLPPRTPTAFGALPPERAAFLPGAALRKNSAFDQDGKNDSRIQQLSRRLGVSDRHVRRIFEAQFGVSPLQYLQTRRLLAAKQLLTDTDLPVTQIALSSGFGSVRRFNAAFVGHYKLNPTALRRAGAKRGVAQASKGREGKHTLGSFSAMNAAGSLGAAQSSTVRLGYRPPYDVVAMVAFFQKRAMGSIEAVESVSNIHTIFRTLAVQAGEQTLAGWLAASFDQPNHQVLLKVSDSLLDVLPLVIRRVRHWLDLDADPEAIHRVMQIEFPEGAGLRVPGSLDGFELAVRAVLGQQITVAAARTLSQRLVDKFGAPIQTKHATPHPALTRLFPSAEVLAQASGDALGSLGIVKQRQATIVAIAQGVANGRLTLHAGADVQATMAALKELPGIGDWTAHYIAMRALRWPDAFPAGDIALHKALGLPKATWGTKNAAKEIEVMSQAWKPWRSYAVLRAWARL